MDMPKFNNIIELQKWWNSQTFILLEMVKQLNGRYLSIMKLDEKKYLIRYLLGYTDKTFKASMERFNAYDQPHRLYYDLTSYQPGKMPMFSFNMQERGQQRNEFNSEADKIAIGMDMAFDFDAPNTDKWKIAWKQCKKLKKLLDNYNIPYSLRWSGAKGFHITIKWQYLPKPLNQTVASFTLRIMETVQELKKQLRLSTLDMSLYDMRRILKLPYSIDGKSGLICLPLTDEQFNNFSLDIVKPESVLKEIIIKNRGLLVRPGTTEGVKQLFKDYG